MFFWEVSGLLVPTYVGAGRVRYFVSFFIPTPLKLDIVNGRSLNLVYQFHMKYFLYRGDVNATMLDILGGLRSACTYVGAGRVKEMPKRTTFIRVTQQLNEVFSNPN